MSSSPVGVDPVRVSTSVAVAGGQDYALAGPQPSRTALDALGNPATAGQTSPPTPAGYVTAAGVAQGLGVEQHTAGVIVDVMPLTRDLYPKQTSPTLQTNAQNGQVTSFTTPVGQAQLTPPVYGQGGIDYAQPGTTGSQSRNDQGVHAESDPRLLQPLATRPIGTRDGQPVYAPGRGQTDAAPQRQTGAVSDVSHDLPALQGQPVTAVVAGGSNAEIAARGAAAGNQGDGTPNRAGVALRGQAGGPLVDQRENLGSQASAPNAEPLSHDPTAAPVGTSLAAVSEGGSRAEVFPGTVTRPGGWS